MTVDRKQTGRWQTNKILIESTSKTYEGHSPILGDLDYNLKPW